MVVRNLCKYCEEIYTINFCSRCGKFLGENKPLTVGELHEIAQKLVGVCYVVEDNERPRSAILDFDESIELGKCNVIAVIDSRGKTFREQDYGKTWLAYRYDER